MACSHRLPWKHQLWLRQYLIQFLILYIFTKVKEDVGTVFRNLVLRNRYPKLIIIFVPLVIVWILHHTDIMAISQGSEMIDYSAQIVAAGDVLTSQKLIVLYVVTKIQISDRKINQSGQFAPSGAKPFKSFKLYSQNWRWPKSFVVLLVLFMRFALSTVNCVW